MRRPVVRLIAGSVFGCLLVALLATAASAAPAADFPPGTFSDGQQYKLADFEGKVVVLFFYEQHCPKCRGLIPERNKVVDQFKDKPVKFIAVAPGDTTLDALAYTRDTKLKMPAFSDLFGVMQTRYGHKISMQNIYQFAIIGPTGDIVGHSMNPDDIEKALAGVKLKYKEGGYHASLNQIVDALDWGQYQRAMPFLKRAMKDSKKEVAESAKKLFDDVKAQGKEWLTEAAKASDGEPVKAYDLYKKVSLAFVGEDLAKEADAALKTLAKNKAVIDELAARAMYDQLSSAESKAQMAQKPLFIKQAQTIATKYPQTPTGKKAKELAEDLDRATAE